MNIHALLFEGHLDAAADLLVDHRQQPVESFDDRDVVAEVRIDGRELDADDSAADDDEFRDLLSAHVDQLGAVDDSRQIVSRDRRCERLGSGGHQDLVGCDLHAVDHDAVLADDRGFSPHEVYLSLDQKSGDAVPERVEDLVLALADTLTVRPEAFGLNAHLCAVLCISVHIR